MFCPQCQAEYRQGFTRCADCEVDLVYELPQEPQAGSELRNAALDGWESERLLIWKGHSQAKCVALCRELMKVDLPYKVAQVREERDGNMRVTWRYEIGVLDKDYKRAKDQLGIEGEFAETHDGPDDEDTGDGVEDTVSLPSDGSPPDEAVRNDSYLKPWYPEDATIEIWTQDGDDISFGIQMALKENQIHCRLDLRGGIREVFVAPEDEPRARQIVREIIEGI